MFLHCCAGRKNKKPLIQRFFYLLQKSSVYVTFIAMALTQKEKSKIIDKFKTHGKDTGSAEVQVAVLTEQISQLTAHLKKHAKDNHSRRGLLSMVARRKKFLDYLKENNIRKYNAVIKKLGLKR